MRTTAEPRTWWGGLVLLTVAVALSLGTFGWVAYRAVAEWQRSATFVATGNAQAAIDLLVTALSRDMRGVQAAALLSPYWEDDASIPSKAHIHRVASLFARYPYPEAFFVWKGSSPSPSSVIFYTRADRHPAWVATDNRENRFPVVTGTGPEQAQRLSTRISRDVTRGRRFSFFDLELGSKPHQVVAFISYTDELRQQANAVFGFVVNLEWVREHYVQDLAGEIAGIQGRAALSNVTVLDETGTPVIGGRRETDADVRQRQFPLLFFDPILLTVAPPDDLTPRVWTAQASPAADAAMNAATAGARQTLVIAALAAMALALGLALTVRTTRAAADLAVMRGEFVASVTHELKTPIASVRAVNELLASGRVTSLDMARKYAQMAVTESKRLARLIDNLLAYARITDVTQVYSPEVLNLEDMVNDSVQRFAVPLTQADFHVKVDIESGLPPLRFDRMALELVIDNLIDNAIRYSRTTRELTITAGLEGRSVRIEVADKGIGIPEDEIAEVVRRFVRGRSRVPGGNGLGLAIVKRVVDDHGGTLAIHSVVDVGTSVVVRFPMTSPMAEPV